MSDVETSELLPARKDIEGDGPGDKPFEANGVAAETAEVDGAASVPEQSEIGEADEAARELAEALRATSAGYDVLSRLFAREVDTGLLQDLRQAKWPASTGNAHLDAGYRGLVRYLGHAWERTLSELSVDYFHTFIGNTQDSSQVAFPYESVYTSPEHLLMQDARDDVLAAYRAAGVVLADGVCEPDDHVAFELEFMGLLGRRAADALEAGEESRAVELMRTRAAFLGAHLLNWTPGLAADMRRIAQTGFYHSLADVLEGQLECDRDLMADVLDDAA